MTIDSSSNPAPKKRTITVITVGSEDYEPTTDELQTLIEQFMAAERDPAGAFIAVKYPYQARVLDVTASEGIMASTGWLSDTDIKVCVKAFNEAKRVSIYQLENQQDVDGILAFRDALDKRMN